MASFRDVPKVTKYAASAVVYYSQNYNTYLANLTCTGQ